MTGRDDKWVGLTAAAIMAVTGMYSKGFLSDEQIKTLKENDIPAVVVSNKGEQAVLNAIAHFNLGVVYSSLNDFERTKIHWNKYIELAPESPIADTLRAYMRQW